MVARQITQEQAILNGATAHFNRLPKNKQEKWIDQLTRELRTKNPNVSAKAVLKEAMLCAYMIGDLSL